MFEKILVGVDGSGHAERALSVAGDLAKAIGAKIVVVHVREGHFAGRGGLFTTEPETDADALVDGYVKGLAETGLPATGRVCQASVVDVATAIVDVAKDEGAGLIVVGSRGHGSVTTMLVGSVAQRVLHEAHRPVLVVPATSV